MGSLEAPKDYGRRLLPVVIEQAARDHPDHVVYSFPITNDVAQGFHEITNSRYANGMHRTSWYIESKFDKPARNTFPTIGYVGPSEPQLSVLSMSTMTHTGR